MVEFTFENGEKVVLSYEDDFKEPADPCEIFVEAGSEQEKMSFCEFVSQTAVNWKAGQRKQFEYILRIILKYLQYTSILNDTIKTDTESKISASYKDELRAEDFIKVEDDLHDQIDDDDSEDFSKPEFKQAKKFQCGVCFKQLCSNHSLQVHVATVHEKRRDFTCSKCLKTFSTNSHLRKHLRSIHGEILPIKSQTSNCDAKLTFSESDDNVLGDNPFISGEDVLAKKAVTDDDDAKEVERYDGEDDKEDRLSYDEFDQTKRFQCGVCYKQLCSNHSLQVHVATVHEKRKDYTCSKCAKTFSTNSHLRKHLRNIHGEVLPHKTPVLKPVLSKDAKLTCSECDLLFSCIEDNVLHVFNEHPQHPEYLPLSLRERVRGRLPWSRSSVWEKSSWTCPVCPNNPIGCETVQGLVSHITQAHSSTSMCWVCGLYWPIEEVSFLLTHMMKEHPIKSIWMCGQCGVYNQSLKHLNDHKKIHTSTESENAIYRCSECSYTTEKAASLRKHKSARHTLANTRIICTECGKILGSKTALKVHASVHNKGNKHKCEICGKEFSQRGYLKTHLLSHTDMRPFACEFCPMSFIGSCGLTSHRRRVHADDIGETQRHLCKQCDKKFWLPGDLKRHVKTIHEGIKDYDCSQCFKCFSTKKSLKRHKINVHRTHSLIPTC